MVRRLPPGWSVRHTAPMPGSSITRIVALAVVLAAVGCTPAPTVTPAPSPTLTPPPRPADASPWGDIAWSSASLPPIPVGVEAERIVAVTAGGDGFVAVGYREADGDRTGAIWFSPDGASWTLVGPAAALAGVDLVAVAATGARYVALGVADGGPLRDRPMAVFLWSDDGRLWHRLAPTEGTTDAFPEAITASKHGFLAIGDASDGGTAAWVSADGRSFERVVLTGTAPGGMVDPEATADGFAALGSSVLPPIVQRSTDGIRWRATPVDPQVETQGYELAIGRWGSIVQGLVAADCGSLAACAGRPAAWWSADGVAWGRLPDASPAADGGSVIVPAGDHGFLAIDGAGAWSSPDGWIWTPLPEPGDGTVAIVDAAVAGDVIVAVGTEDLEDGTTIGRILVAADPESGG